MFVSLRNKTKDKTKIMNKRFIVISCLLCMALWAVAAQKMASPNGLIGLQSKEGGYVICYQKQPVLEISALGYEGMKQGQLLLTPSAKINSDYIMLSGKKKH